MNSTTKKVKLFLLTKLQESKLTPETKKELLEKIKNLKDINEGAFNNLNCKRLKSALAHQQQEYKNLIQAAAKATDEKKRKTLADSAKGIKFTMNKTKEKIKKSCQGA